MFQPYIEERNVETIYVHENYKWIDILPRLASNYNARKHRTIGMCPVDVTPAIANRLLITVYNCVKIAASARYKVNDYVATNVALDTLCLLYVLLSLYMQDIHFRFKLNEFSHDDT